MNTAGVDWFDEVAIECQGPVGGECGRVIREHVPDFDTRADVRAIRCDDCGRINHARIDDRTVESGVDGGEAGA